MQKTMAYSVQKPSRQSAKVRVFVAVGVGFALLLVANELFGMPPFTLTPSRVPQRLVGHWTAGEMSLGIRPDGVVTGKFHNGAVIKDAVLKPNRTWLGRLLRWRTDYIILGDLTAADENGDIRFSAPLTDRDGALRLSLFKLSQGGKSPSHFSAYKMEPVQ